MDSGEPQTSLDENAYTSPDEHTAISSGDLGKVVVLKST